MSIADELHKLDSLYSSGALTADEYTRAKALVLNGQHVASSPPAGGNILKRFARSNRDYWLGGVCGGLGEYTPIPSWAWRMLFCLAGISFGGGILAYVLLWIFVPAEGATD